MLQTLLLAYCIVGVSTALIVHAGGWYIKWLVQCEAYYKGLGDHAYAKELRTARVDYQNNGQLELLGAYIFTTVCFPAVYIGFLMTIPVWFTYER